MFAAKQSPGLVGFDVECTHIVKEFLTLMQLTLFQQIERKIPSNLILQGQNYTESKTREG